MSLLIQTEGKLTEYYERTGKGTRDEKLRAFFTQLAKYSSSRINLIQKVRVERVMELTLEPITDLNLTDLIATFDDAVRDENIPPLEMACRLEKTISKLYARASPRIMQASPDTGELLLELSRENLERGRELEQYTRSV